MGAVDERPNEPVGGPLSAPGQTAAAGTLVQRLDLPEEVGTGEAAAILNCSKHTVLQYLEEGLLEWRDAAPPSSTRPVYRITLRSVLDLRLGYQRGSPRPRAGESSRPRRRTAGPGGYRVQHLRRHGSKTPAE
jgi:hypothetical protein